MTAETLFDLEDVPVDQADDLDDDSWVQLRDDDTAQVCCRLCQTATTAAGIDNRGHGPDSTECARMLAWPHKDDDNPTSRRTR